ncbi:MAG: protein-glutamate O-methyltransferase CheR [Acidobacteria bacterium]|nr:protein-glutamate O-methyltransferase CheR [Acidobacteriota bacterium]
MTRQEFTALRDFVYTKSGIFFAESKQYFLENRLSRRLGDLNLSSYMAYLDLLQGPRGREELKLLFIEVTTNETSFWRNPPQIEAFQKVVMPEVAQLVRARGASRIRMWSAACSSGEEPYTLAMVAAECQDSVLRGLTVEIVATDISERVLEQARTAVYGSYTLRNLSPQQMAQHLVRAEGDNFAVKANLKAMVQLRHFNLVDYQDYRNLGTFDVIFCRNVLIYFDDAVKGKVIKGFHEQLASRSYLMVGHSESIHAFNTGFELIHFSKAMGYRKRT